MSRRREFSKPVYVEIVRRATVNGVIRCEACGCAVARFEVHHVKEDALEIDKSARLTAGEGKLLCRPCHGDLTRPFQAVISKVKRVEAKHMGARKAPTLRSAGFVSAPPQHSSRAPSKTCAGMSALARQFQIPEDA